MKCRNCKHLGWAEEEPGKLFFGWCSKVLDSPDPDIERECRGFERATNLDIVRRMSGEELAELLYNIYKRACLDFANQVGLEAKIMFEDGGESEETIPKWLQKPAGEDTDEPL